MKFTDQIEGTYVYIYNYILWSFAKIFAHKNNTTIIICYCVVHIGSESFPLNTYLTILKRALMGFSPKSGGVLSAISMAVIPSDHTSALRS